MNFERSSGILLHPTSLPGPYGIGDLGPQAHGWIDYLADHGCTLWQVLPLGPTGYGDSPYQSFSAFAGNPYLISPESLLADNLIHANELANLPQFPAHQVDYGAVIPWKLDLLDRSYEYFGYHASPNLSEAFRHFQAVQVAWLEDYALFMALKDVHGGAPWPTWEPELRDRDPEALEAFTQKHLLQIQRHTYRQFLFYRQWAALKLHAAQRKIRIIGDIPIFAAHDSADVWAHPELFYLDEKGMPTSVAGVPPDYFSPTGQLWGNPLYRWDRHRDQGYQWWIERVQGVLQLVDIVRIDHFRGFVGYWEVPGDAKTAEKGRWAPGPGADFFDAVREKLGELPIIAEDLGVITPDVVALRERYELPGMKILQFAFAGGPIDPFLPHNYPVNCVAYTGTHDNDTARGWYERVEEDEKDFYRHYMNRDGRDIAWDLIRGVWSSVAVFAIAPLQDFLDLDNSARMNYPGRPSGNWTWRMPAGALSEALGKRISELNYLYLRSPQEAGARAPAIT
jgi:4-alpha-glucanotransferase